MVEINSRVATGIGVNAYQQALNNENTRSQAQIIDENNRLNREQERGFAPVDENDFENFDLTIPRKSEINYSSRLQEMNSENFRNLRAREERQYQDDYRNRLLRERGIGVNINVLI